MPKTILIINTGNTSTKVGLYTDGMLDDATVIRHDDAELARFTGINDQKEFRESLVLDYLKSHQLDAGVLAAVAARGGILRPMESGTYLVDETMIRDLIEARRGLHASHLSAQIGYSIAQKGGIDCYIVDPITVDEFDPVARISGHQAFSREMRTHALNLKAVAKRFAKETLRRYTDLNLVVVHLGTGVSISMHHKGRMVDAMDPCQEGAFSLDRAGGLPILQVARYITKNRMEYDAFSRMVFGEGGVYSYLETRDFKQVTKRFHEHDEAAVKIVHALVYQIAKEVGALSTVVCGALDAILLTGGMAYQEYFTDLIKQRVRFLAPVHCYPGEDEIQALAEGVFRILNNEERALKY
ncbi:MAG TPA: butyrate kinase [Candidatus Aminicenantes bacterium]|nr:butyrate kinase [Candidatus Aminicenantes bacterium]